MVSVRLRDEVLELTPEEFEERVRAGRIPGEALVRFEPLTGDRYVEASSLETWQALRNEARITFEGRFIAGAPPIATALIVGVTTRFFWWGGQEWPAPWPRVPPVYELLSQRFVSLTAAQLEDGELWRIFTMALLHTELPHFATNTLWLAYTAWNIERALGWRNLVAIYLTAIVTGSTFSMFGSPWGPTLGASGGIFGLVAASVAFGFLHSDLLQRRARAVFGLALLPYLVIMFWSGLQNEGVDNWCHLGGLVGGGLVALLLDPEGIERRPGWNRRVWTGLAALGVVLALVLGLGGPRLEPLVDHRVAKEELRVRRGEPRREIPADEGWLSFDVPAGWAPGADVARGAAFLSPMYPGHPRGFGVRADTAERLVAPEERLAAWTKRLVADWPAAQVSEPVPIELAGRPAVLVTATLSPDDPRIVEWRCATRGAHALEAVWQVDRRLAGRLAPLRDRLLGRIEWRDPEELATARAEVEERATPSRRAALALALARAGEADEALATAEALVASAPSDPARWVDLLDVVEVLAPRLGDTAPWWDRALAAAPAPAVIAAVADAMGDAGRPELARGLLRIAWDDAPGDATLKRARRRHDLPTALAPDSGVPWDLAYEPVRGRPRDPAEIELRRAASPSVAEAATAGERIAEERGEAVRAAIDAVRSGDPAGVVPLLALKDGVVARDDADAVAALRDDLGRAAKGQAADWIAPELVAALSEHPDYPDSLR